MTQVKCYAKKCEHNEYGVCQLSCIELEESDLLWKDCGQSKERKTEQTDCDHKCVQTEVGCEQTDCAWGKL